MSTSTRFDSSYTQVSVFAGSAQIHCVTDAFCKKSSLGSVDGILKRSMSEKKNKILSNCVQCTHSYVHTMYCTHY